MEKEILGNLIKFLEIFWKTLKYPMKTLKYPMKSLKLIEIFYFNS